MQVWVVCLVVFFGAAEFYQWARGLALPLPILIAAGALLAIASNTSKFPNLLRPDSISADNRKAIDSQLSGTTVVKISPDASPAETVTLEAAVPSRYYPGPQLPNLYPQVQPTISFTIRQPEPIPSPSEATENQ